MAGKVLEHPDGRIVFESIIVCQYLDEIFPEDCLTPQDPYQKACDRFMMAWYQLLFTDGESEEGKATIEAGLHMYDQELEKRQKGPFFGGGGLDTHFPRLDFLCMQEVFDGNYNKVLRKELHKVFPYILHDIGVTSLSSNYFLLNSGLLFASRFPVLQADFKFFPHSVSQCIFSSETGTVNESAHGFDSIW
nr:hypothetical protein BaRGS_031635 [Batillaria attramentaria]